MTRWIDIQKKRPKKSGYYFILYSYSIGPLTKYTAKYVAKEHRWENTVVDADIRYWMKGVPKIPKK